MNALKRENLLLLGILICNTVWLVSKAFFGEENYRDPAFNLLIWTTLVGLLVIGLPYLKRLLPFDEISWITKVNDLLRHDDRLRLTVLLVAILLIDLFFATFIIEDIITGDEASFEDSVAILTGEGWNYFFDNYAGIQWLGKQHPPLPILIVSGVVQIFNSDIEMTGRVISILFGLGTMGCTYLIANRLYDHQVALFSVALLYCLRYFFPFHIVSSMDIYVIFFFTLTVWLLIELNTVGDRINRQSVKWVILAGLAISLGMLSKYSMVFAYLLLPGMFLWPFYNRFSKRSSSEERHLNIKTGLGLSVMVVLCSLPLLAIWVYYLFVSEVYVEQFDRMAWFLGADIDIVPPETTANLDVTVDVKDITYLSEWRINQITRAITHKIIGAIGLHYMPLILLGLWTWFQDFRSGSSKWRHLFIIYWILIIFIPVSLTLPIDRYYMPAYPAIAILAGYGVSKYLSDPLRTIGLTLFFTICSMSLITG